MSAVMLAINWEPELRGILTVIIGTVVWMGSIYLILGTNMGARLGFIVTLTGFFGWMAIMGAIWWMYGIGLQGEAASWEPVSGEAVIQEVELLHSAGVLDESVEFGDDQNPTEKSDVLDAALEGEGWSEVDPSNSAYGQATAEAGSLLESEGAFAAGEYEFTRVYEVNPPEESAYPKLGPNGEFDQLAFLHKPYYTVVEVAPYEPLYTEPGRAPISPEVDIDAQRQYVYMIRDLGSLREPAAYITIGSTVIFLGLCFLLHRRDQFVSANLAKKAAAAA